jgi:hypothetical protein
VRARPCSLTRPRSPPPAARVTMLVTRLSGWELGMVVGAFLSFMFYVLFLKFQYTLELTMDKNMGYRQH